MCYRVVPAGYGCISHETRYLPEPPVGIICLSFLHSQLSARAMTVSQGKEGINLPAKLQQSLPYPTLCQLQVGETLYSPHRAGATRTNRLLNFKPLRWRQTPLYGPVYLCISPQYGEHRCLQYPHGRGSEFYPPTGGASRAFGLPQAAAKRLFAGGSPHPLFPPCGAN